MVEDPSFSVSVSMKNSLLLDFEAKATDMFSSSIKKGMRAEVIRALITHFLKNIENKEFIKELRNLLDES